MNSLQELKAWVQAGQQNARKDQNLLPFLFKRDMKKSRTGAAGKGGRKLSDKGHSTTVSASVGWTGGHQSHAIKQKCKRKKQRYRPKVGGNN